MRLQTILTWNPCAAPTIIPLLSAVVIWLARNGSSQEIAPGDDETFEKGEARQLLVNQSAISTGNTTITSASSNTSVITLNSTILTQTMTVNETSTSLSNGTLNTTSFFTTATTNATGPANQTLMNVVSSNNTVSSTLNSTIITSNDTLLANSSILMDATNNTGTSGTASMPANSTTILLNATSTTISPLPSSIGTTGIVPITSFDTLLANSTPTSTGSVAGNTGVPTITTNSTTSAFAQNSTLPSIFFLGTGSNSTVSAISTMVSPITTASAASAVTMTVTPTTLPASLSTATQVVVSNNSQQVSMAADAATATLVSSFPPTTATTKPSIVINIDIDLGRPTGTPSATTPSAPILSPSTTLQLAGTTTTVASSAASAILTSPVTLGTTATLASTGTTASPVTFVTGLAIPTSPARPVSLTSSDVSLTSTLLTLAPASSPTPVPATISNSPGGNTVPTTTIPTLAAASVLNLAGNGTQVVCFSLPFDLLERLLPLLHSFGVGPPASVTSTPVNNGINTDFGSSPLFNPVTPLTPVPLGASTTLSVPWPSMVTTVSPITANSTSQTRPQLVALTTSTTSTFPFLGPYGVGSYGGFRPALDTYTALTASPINSTVSPSISTDRPADIRLLNPFVNLQDAAGVIPYYTFPPSIPPSPTQSSLTTGSISRQPISPQVAIVRVSPVPSTVGQQASSSAYGVMNPVSLIKPDTVASNISGSNAPAQYSHSVPPFADAAAVSSYGVIGMPGYAFANPSAGGAYGDTLQAVVVQPQSWSVTGHTHSKTLTEAPFHRQLHDHSIDPSDEAIKARNSICGPQRDVVPDAITVTQDGIMHVFTGKSVYGFREGNRGKQKPVWMSQFWDRWPGIDKSLRNITAATTRQDGTTFLFSGDSYWKFDNTYQMSPDSPKKIKLGFPGISRMDAVYQAPAADGDMNFLQEESYYTYNHKRFPPYRGPTPISVLGLPTGLDMINAAYTEWKNDDVVLVRGQLMYRLSAGQMVRGYPRKFSTLFDC